MDREKIIAAMEWCRENPCDGCPYEQNEDAGGRCTISDDTIVLLKEQKAMRVQYSAIGGLRYGACPKCNARVDNLVNPKACGFCGQELKWE